MMFNELLSYILNTLLLRRGLFVVGTSKCRFSQYTAENSHRILRLKFYLYTSQLTWIFFDFQVKRFAPCPLFNFFALFLRGAKGY